MVIIRFVKPNGRGEESQGAVPQFHFFALAAWRYDVMMEERTVKRMKAPRE
jgi:hypothetical protein